ncbi:hypothetical protein GCM10007160_37460 [Litchfieldella qijiaojingensis]|uniref:Uncharacterized protein n=1 Tax=Litchfieldella qijiaojingensis TaxID=980347 RepID=A0ABQ2Z6A8_9GAMM|nr:hypothetical protein GCM10007160_37460 [Halomonas qijiaojingensis]
MTNGSWKPPRYLVGAQIFCAIRPTGRQSFLDTVPNYIAQRSCAPTTPGKAARYLVGAQIFCAIRPTGR